MKRRTVETLHATSRYAVIRAIRVIRGSQFQNPKSKIENFKHLLKKITIMDIDVLIGTIQLFPYTFAPMGWMSCEGQLMNITQNQALYSLIGTKFGGDGRTNFALPNLNGASPLSQNKYYIAMTGLYPSRD
jgi:hypothetical protein